MNNSKKLITVRYNLIDSIRGLTLVSMVLFHLFYDIFEIYELNTGWYFTPLTVLWEKSICFSFILISGISLNFSHKAFKRGLLLNFFGFLITAVTVIIIPNQAIWFGILNFLGCAMLIVHPLRAYFEKVMPLSGAAVSMLLFAFFYGLPSGYIGFFNLKILELPKNLYQIKWLSFIGLRSPDFFSTDYFPIFPWIFLFIFGYFLWRFFKSINAEKLFTVKIPFLNIIGKYSLWIYLAHQPIIIGILMLLSKI